MSKKEPKTNKNGLSLSLSCITGDYRAEESSMRHEAGTPLVAKEAASAASQLLMTAGMNGHDPIAYEWTVRQAFRYCTHLQISMDTHTHTLWDMARWCNPLVFCVSYSPPPQPCWDYAAGQSDFGPLSSDDARWMTGVWVSEVAMPCSRPTVHWVAQPTVLAGSAPRCQNLLGLPFLQPVTGHHSPGKTGQEPEPGVLGRGSCREWRRHLCLEETDVCSGTSPKADAQRTPLWWHC